MKAPVRGLRAVVHVVAKDLRRHRVAMAGYGAVVAVAAGFGVWGAAIPGIAPLAVILVGTGIAVLVVHEDPPFRTHAFWARHPVAPGTVYGAKILVIFGGILGAALAGQGAVLIGFGVPLAELPRLLLASIPAAGSFLLVGLLLAASFRTLTGVAAAAAGGFVLLPLMSAVLFFLLTVGVLIPVTPAGTSLLWGGAAVGGIVWAGLRYTSPDDSTTGRFLGAVLALVVALGGLVQITGPVGRGAPGVHPDERVAAHPPLEGVVVELLSVTGSGSGSSGPFLSVGVMVHGPDSAAAYRIHPESARLIRPGGTSRNLPVDSRRTERYGLPPEVASRWIGHPPSVSRRDEVRIRPDPSQWEALQAGEARVELTAVVERLESREVGTMRLGTGSSMGSGGTRIRQVESEPGDPGAVHLHEIIVGPGPTDPRSRAFGADLAGTTLAYALLSPGAEEGVFLRFRGGSGGGPGPGPFSNAGLLFPGPAVREWSSRWMIPAEALDELDHGWMDRARLHAFEWVVAGTDRIVSEPVVLSVPESMRQDTPGAGRPAIPVTPMAPTVP